jgi:hypothetical protein
VRTIAPDALIGRIRATLAARPHTPSHHHFMIATPPTEPAAYALVVGAGFSHPVIPLVRELMHETIGDYYFPDQDMSSLERPRSVRRKDSASFWKRFNEAASEAGLPAVAVDRDGLPADPAAAYLELFTYEGAEVLLALREREERRQVAPSWLGRLQRSRPAAKPPAERERTGERFVKGFLRYVIDPGHGPGRGSTGRSDLNVAHAYLAALLEAQQAGRDWRTCAFCRTIFTTNFDTLLPNALQMVNLLYSVTDRPERGLDRTEFEGEELAVHLVYTHGSILRHNPASAKVELDRLAEQNVEVLREQLESRDVIAVGYSGWEDGLMTALRECEPGRHMVYWCDIRQQPAPNVVEFLGKRGDNAAYVRLGEDGAGGLMRSLYHALVVPDEERDPMQRYRDWRALTHHG